jgi:hypothetical protein
VSHKPVEIPRVIPRRAFYDPPRREFYDLFDTRFVVTIRAGSTSAWWESENDTAIRAITCPQLPASPRRLRVRDYDLDLRVLHAEASRPKEPARLSNAIGVRPHERLFFHLVDLDGKESPLTYDVELHVYSVQTRPR